MQSDINDSLTTGLTVMSGSYCSESFPAWHGLSLLQASIGSLQAVLQLSFSKGVASSCTTLSQTS